MPGNHVRHQLTKRAAFNSMLCPRQGMIYFPRTFTLMGVSSGAQVALKFVGVFAEIVPESGNAAPFPGGLFCGLVREHVGGEFRSQVGHFVEVPVITLQFRTVGAKTAVGCRTFRREKGLPLFRGRGITLFVDRCVGVEKSAGASTAVPPWF